MMYQVLPTKSTNDQQTFVVIDDHERMLNGTVMDLKRKYPDARIYTAQNTRKALQQIKEFKPNLVVVDLAMPEVEGETARTEVGIQLLKTLMEQYPMLNIVVQSDNFLALIQLKLAINEHLGGFTVVAKGDASEVFLARVNLTLQGGIRTPKEIRNGIELKPEWNDVLQLGCKEGFQDEAIAKRLHCNPKTVQNYWAKIRDVLEIYPDAEENRDKNIRMLTAVRAREFGLID